MYSMLIIDDEPRHRKGLAEMVRRLRPNYIVTELKNGKEALDFLSINPVQIIITDIKMPIMDGLELLAAIEGKVKDIKVVILSAYGYFEYAQKAIAMGAFDYLLKPVDEEKVIGLLHKVEAAIQSKNSEIVEKEKLKSQLNNALPAYIELQLNKWIKGTLNISELKEIEGIFPYSGYGTVIATEIDNFNSMMEGISPEDRNEIRLNIKYWMKDILNSIGHSISFFLQGNNEIMLTILNADEDFNLDTKENQDRFQTFILAMKNDYGLDIDIGLGGKTSDIFNDIETAYEQAQFALRSKFFASGNKIFSYSQENVFSGIQVFSKCKEEDDLTEAIKGLDKDNAFKAMECIYNRITVENTPEPSQVKDAIIQVLLHQIKVMNNITKEEIRNQLASDISIKIRKAKRFEEIKEAVHNIFLTFFDTIADQKNTKSEQVFEKCIKYIDSHYMEDLSLEQVSELFYFNTSYFSTLFKSQVGINFSQYLLNLRLKKSRELLLKTDCKVYEVALKVGYKDPKYFNRVFKKEFGITPDDYRRQQFSV